MHIAITIEDALVEEAVRLTGVEDKIALVKLGLQKLIDRETHQRLVKMGEIEPQFGPVKRRRNEP